MPTWAAIWEDDGNKISNMARVSGVGAGAPDPTAINLTRLLARLQKTLLQPDSATEHRLRTSSYERSKAAANLEYARTLLLRLEQDAATIKIQSKKQEAQTELLQKRNTIQQLSEQLQELEHFGNGSEEDTSEGEDLLGEDTPSDGAEESETPPEPAIEAQSSSPVEVDPSPSMPSPTERDQLFPPELRSRHVQSGSLAMDTARTTSSAAAAEATAATPSLTEKMLSHNRSEQESLTESLLSMAKALKSSTQAFSHSLESEKDIMDRATEGLDRNSSGLEAASRRMGYLRTMTEGRGWWGRMLMYAWIFGLMFVALFIVGFLPKLRF